MDKIDFSSFNKPKHFPQWLCSGDTLKLAEYDDAQLEELDKNIRDMSEQFDIDNASGAELDRIGKVLGEDRGGNSDRIYRIYLKLRTGQLRILSTSSNSSLHRRPFISCRTIRRDCESFTTALMTL